MNRHYFISFNTFPIFLFFCVFQLSISLPSTCLLKAYCYILCKSKCNLKFFEFFNVFYEFTIAFLVKTDKKADSKQKKMLKLQNKFDEYVDFSLGVNKITQDLIRNELYTTANLTNTESCEILV